MRDKAQCPSSPAASWLKVTVGALGSMWVSSSLTVGTTEPMAMLILNNPARIKVLISVCRFLAAWCYRGGVRGDLCSLSGSQPTSPLRSPRLLETSPSRILAVRPTSV